jgi:hypothetical protein
MWRAVAAAVMAGAMALAGCTVDSHAPFPQVMRGKEAEPARLDPEPDLKQLLRDKLDAVFTATSRPRHVRVSPPRREPTGAGWTACVKAELTSVIGRSLGTQTYVVTILGGVIQDRRRVEADDNCASETYEAI